MTLTPEQRLDPIRARETVERILPDEKRRRLFVDLAADVIVQSADVSPNSWAAALFEEAFTLNVGRLLVLRLRPKDFWIALHTPTLSEESRKHIAATAIRIEEFYSAPDVFGHVLPIDALDALPPDVRNAVLAAARRGAGRVSWSPYYKAHSSGLVSYFADFTRRDLPDAVRGPGSGGQGDLPTLFDRFLSTYMSSPEGKQHLDFYSHGRGEGVRNFEAIRKADEVGDDITERVLAGLLPHVNSPANRERGAWIHIAPAINGDIRSWFEAAGWVRPQDWPAIARSIYDFVRACADAPEELEESCRRFAEAPHIKGLQTGMLTPILNALHPDRFMVVNNKSRNMLQELTGGRFSQKITDYPHSNGALWDLVDTVLPMAEAAGYTRTEIPDLLDAFAHWYVAIWKKQDSARGREGEEGGSRVRKASKHWAYRVPAEGWSWEDCLRTGQLARGVAELGDVSGLTQSGAANRIRNELTEIGPWKKNDLWDVWRFTRMKPGHRVIVHDGSNSILGVARVVRGYRFISGDPHPHRIGISWEDQKQRPLRLPLTNIPTQHLPQDAFEALAAGSGETYPEIDPGKVAEEPVLPVSPDAPFSATTFRVLRDLSQTPTREFYTAHREKLRLHVQEPVQAILAAVRDRLDKSLLDLLETEKNVFARFVKNDYGRGGAYDYFWGAFYPKGSRRIEDLQLYVVLDKSGLRFGFDFGSYSADRRRTFLERMSRYQEDMFRILKEAVPAGVVFGTPGSPDEPPSGLDGSLEAWVKAIESAPSRGEVRLSAAALGQMRRADLITRIVETFSGFLPLVKLTLSQNPATTIRELLGDPGDNEVHPAYPLSECAAETLLEERLLDRWARAIRRKGQAVLYGPPGTGKTFIAGHLARHLVGGGDGIVETVQFHPSYSYEDFMQGIRPRTRTGGSLEFAMEPGRFLDFCERARSRTGVSVLIIDEINRANLSRVFGELMYLLEYRGNEIPISGGGTFGIPENVYLIGTMNTADRSIALVDHALRRRFAFLEIAPDYELLERFHRRHARSALSLIQVLKRLNQRIGDRHYHVGISYFLVPDLAKVIEDVWTMEIEPYIDEYFFDHPDVAADYAWTAIEREIEL